MDELWQLFAEDGRPIHGKGANKDDVFAKGLLHGAAHVWIWRNNNGQTEVLLQKRAANKRTWPNRLDISAAGHIDVGEGSLTVALRETSEEIGIDVEPELLEEIVVVKAYMIAENEAIENEFQWLYLLELANDIKFSLQETEVDSLVWKRLDDFAQDSSSELYVPHGKEYYEKVVTAIRAASSRTN